MNILLVYPEFPDTFWSFKHALKFIHKKASSPPLGLLTVAAMLPAEWDKRLVDMNVRPLRPADLDWADMVWISAMVVQRDSVLDVIERCQQKQKKIVAGGPLFTCESSRFSMVDHLILNEAEITLPPFLADLAADSPQRVYATSEFADMHQTPTPLWNLIDMREYDSLSIQFTRGCPFNCEFCNVTALLGHRVRTKTTRQIIAELDQMYSLGWRRNIFFVDDNFIGNRRLLKEEILPALIEWRKNKTGCRFITEASINLADDEELMDLMVRAGFVSVFVGIETPDENSLAECHKMQNKNRNLVESVRQLQRKGLQVMGGFIVGFDNDTPSIFQRQIEFIQNSGIITAMVGLLQAPNGTQLYQRMKAEGRLIEEMTGDNTDGTTNIVPLMDQKLLHNGYRSILATIYSPKMFYQRVRTFLKEYHLPPVDLHLEPAEIGAFFRSIWLLGIWGPERREYWRLFFWTLFHCPQKFPLAITFSIYGYHFRRVSQIQGLSA
ncbi:MAG: B12-binding domain-containing radical SAM protein [Chloroflexi bacterium]|nr:B12-binding domain-containing radical SAM protein [Chloroflexota bacterium]